VNGLASFGKEPDEPPLAGGNETGRKEHGIKNWSGRHGRYRKTHADVYQQDDLAELGCRLRRQKEKADEAAAKYGVPAFYTLHAMLQALPEIDIVDVTHPDMKMAAGITSPSWKP
jgi:hypothetical protein